jgi:succinate-semialdehyde dehydrogenase/glutarate-semialdehyde dehydrogenase
MTLLSINPTTGKILKTFKEDNEEKINTHIVTSHNAFDQWSYNTYDKRKKLLEHTAQVLQKHKQKYAELMTLEMGKPIHQSEQEIEKCAWVCRYYADNGKRFLDRELVQTNAVKSYVQFIPLGSILAIMPWNFPFWQVIRHAIPALFAGNTLLLKHSSNVPQCALALEQLFLDAGFPENVIQSIMIGSHAVSKLISNEGVAAVTFTGSSAAGRNIAQQAGLNLKKTVLELGGSDPFIVFDDADILFTAKKAVQARMINNGQSCIAAKRFIVMEKVFDAFAVEVLENVKQLVVGDPLDKSTDIGPLAREADVKHLDAQVTQSVHHGATVLYGGKQIEDSPGFFYQPSVISNVKKGMAIYEEETFGPVITLIKAKNQTEALKVANDTCYGLGASIWTNNLEKAEALAHRLHAGTVAINDLVKSDPRLPFGGVKQSGYGRELSEYGIKEFVNIQTIYLKNHGKE